MARHLARHALRHTVNDVVPGLLALFAHEATKGAVSFLSRGTAASPSPPRQRRDLLQTGFVARQLGAHQASRGTDNLGA